MPVDGGALHLPDKPGVYQFKRADGVVLYVGKATSLKERVRSYFAKNPDREMIPRLVSEADTVDCIVTPNPSQALTLEREMIRTHKPRFNSLMTDDKSYPFIALSDEAAPRLMYTRHPPDGATLWGPFPDVGAAKRVIHLLRREFGIRDCPSLLPQGCLAMHIGMCAAPCIDDSGYERRVQAVREVLGGSALTLLTALQDEMDEASEGLRFEAAAEVRDVIAAVQKTLSQSVISSRLYQDLDAIGFAARGDVGAVVILHASDGVVKGQTHYPIIHRGDAAKSIELVLSEHYLSQKPPRLLLMGSTPDSVTARWLSERRGGRVEVRQPIKGELVRLRTLADQNAEIQAGRILERQSYGNLESQSTRECAEYLGMESLESVVCFDMAQLQGDERVGASITLHNGRPDKSEYRTYRVKGVAEDDLRMMREVVERWLVKQDVWPDLLLIDGGMTHLAVVESLLVEHGLGDRMTLAALAKREETLFRCREEPLILDRRGRLLIFARDEAHRFVNTYHRKRRRKSRLSDPLQEVEGLGAKKLQSLLRHFGGRRGIEDASEADLRRAPGIGRELARRIHDHYHG